MYPHFPPNFKSGRRQDRSTQAPKRGGLRDARGNAWSAADLATAANRGAAYLARQVLPALDPSDPRAGA